MGAPCCARGSWGEITKWLRTDSLDLHSNQPCCVPDCDGVADLTDCMLHATMLTLLPLGRAQAGSAGGSGLHLAVYRTVMELQI